MRVNKWHLIRMQWLLQKRLEEELENVPIEVIVKELAGVVTVYIRSEVMGQAKSAVAELDIPAGPWQALKACLGLPYRKRRVYVSAYQVFPDLKIPKDQRTFEYIEIEPEETVEP